MKPLGLLPARLIYHATVLAFGSPWLVWIAIAAWRLRPFRASWLPGSASFAFVAFVNMFALWSTMNFDSVGRRMVEGSPSLQHP